MDFSTLANGIYANIHAIVRRSEQGELEAVGRKEFLEEAERAWNEAAEKRAAQKLYAGSETRTKLTDTEIAVLRNKYNARSMSGEQYDAFLDDLEDMGAISRWEKGLLGYKGNVVVWYPDENGEAVSCDPGVLWMTVLPEGSTGPAFYRSEANGDTLKWVTDRLLWKPVGKTQAQQKAQAAELDMFKSLSAILSRMAGVTPADTAGSEDKEDTDIVRELADPGSSFYQDMYQRLKLQLQQSEEEKEKQAIIDALDGILESMRAEDGGRPRKSTGTSMVELSRQINALDEDDPRRRQLELLRQRLGQLGIYLDLDSKTMGGRDSDGKTLTQTLIGEEMKEPSIFDLI